MKYNDPIAQNNGIISPTELRTRMDNVLPQFSILIDDTTIAAVAQKPISQLPSFRYVTPRLHHGNNCVILGMFKRKTPTYFAIFILFICHVVGT